LNKELAERQYELLSKPRNSKEREELKIKVNPPQTR